ncbi:MAG: hypothetical protein JJ992_04670, partial [Planctomycetes bacterium]|nr:hypothetical protein [Planctomycetota bacterium]
MLVDHYGGSNHVSMPKLETMMAVLKIWIPMLIGFVLGLPCINVKAENWPQFRGIRTDGVTTSSCPKVWDSSKNVRWKTPIAGEGWSCPVVWGDSVFLTTAVPMDRSSKSSQPESYRGGGGRQRSDLTKAEYRWELICLDTGTGKIRWR